ncbi:MAG: VOC family protein [Bacteroidia bacterium]|nr:VOC family protein [Bacteroidia bacterium]
MNLNQVTVPVVNMASSIAFYTKLGLKLIVHSNDDYARFECPGGSTFSLQREHRVSTKSGIHVYFECEDLDEKVQGLLNEGVSFLELPNDKPWLWREAHLEDPDANHIVLYLARENRLNPPWRIS